MEDVKVIDVMNYPRQCVPELIEEAGKFKEFTMLAQIYDRPDWRPPFYPSLEELIEAMDKTGFDRIIISPAKMWCYLEHRPMDVMGDIELVHRLVEKSKGRLIGAASYSPFKIKESLQEIEKGVQEYGFKYVYFHGITYGLALNDKRFYPCYGKCEELGIPVGMQVGHSAELLPSWGGRPMYLDQVALDFPTLRINLSHTGYPWIEEWMSLVRKYPNVYGDISAWPPSALSPELVRFIGSKTGQNKVMFGTNGRGLNLKDEFLKLPIRDEAKRKILRDNALKFFNL